MKFSSNDEQLLGVKDPKGSFGNIVGRTIRIVRKRFDCELKYLPLTDDMVVQGQRSSIIKNLLSNNQKIILDGRLYYPIRQVDQVIAAAEISAYHHLDEDQLKDLRKLVTVVLEAAVRTITSLETLDRLEHAIQMSRPPLDNVIRLDQFLKARKSQDSMRPVEDEPPKVSFSTPCLIECKNQLDLFKMAHEIHTHSGRYAFIPLEDFDDGFLCNPFEINHLGAMTIFIKSITAVSLDRQESLLQFLNEFRAKKGPQIICGTSIALSDLMNDPRVNRRLVERLSHAYLRMAHPFEEYIKKGVIEFFYESLNHPTPNL